MNAIRFKTLELTNVVLLALLSLAALLEGVDGTGWRGFWSAAFLGALLMGVNISLLGRLLKRLLGGASRKGVQLLIFIALGLKTLFLGLAVFLLLHYLHAAPLGLVSGAMLVLLVPLILIIGNTIKKIPPFEFKE